MTAQLNVIILDSASASLINEVHEVVKPAAQSWWHRFTSTWIVLSETSTQEWRDLIRPVIAGKGASVLVMRLPPEEAHRNWSYFGAAAKDRCEWLHENVK